MKRADQDTKCLWTRPQVKGFVRDAIEESVGRRGWLFLGKRNRLAIIRAKAFDVLCMQEEHLTMNSVQIRDFQHEMLKEADLLE